MQAMLAWRPASSQAGEVTEDVAAEESPGDVDFGALSVPGGAAAAASGGDEERPDASRAMATELAKTSLGLWLSLVMLRPASLLGPLLDAPLPAEGVRNRGFFQAVRERRRRCAGAEQPLFRVHAADVGC